MERELIKNSELDIVIICNFCDDKFLIKVNKSLYNNQEEIKKILESTQGWCGQCVDGNS